MTFTSAFALSPACVTKSRVLPEASGVDEISVPAPVHAIAFVAHAAEPGFDPAAPDREALERLARIEHRRWIAERIAQGWRRSEHRDDARFLHPSLVPYDALSEEEREKDRAQVVTVLRLWREGHAA